jgi:hypothetical protein
MWDPQEIPEGEGDLVAPGIRRKIRFRTFSICLWEYMREDGTPSEWGVVHPGARRDTPDDERSASAAPGP